MSNNTYNELWIKLVTKVEAIFFSIEMNEIDKSNVHLLEMTKALLAMMLSEEKDISFGRSSHSNVNTSIFTYDIWGRNKCDVLIIESWSVANNRLLFHRLNK